MVTHTEARALLPGPITFRQDINRVFPLSFSWLFADSVLYSKDNHNNKLVALKIIDCDIVDFKHSRLRDVTVPEIIKEIQILQGLKNQGAKNTQQILSAFAFHSQVWILSEYCPGGSISTLVSQSILFTSEHSFSLISIPRLDFVPLYPFLSPRVPQVLLS